MTDGDVSRSQHGQRKPFPTRHANHGSASAAEAPASTLSASGPGLTVPVTPALGVDSNSAQQATDLLGKLALNAWLQGIEPNRNVPRPEGFFDKIVETLWDADARTSEDIAEIVDPREVIFDSPAQRGFFTKQVYPAAVRQFGGQLASCASQQNKGESLTESLLQQQLQLFEKLGGIGTKPGKHDANVTVELMAELEALGLGELADECVPNGEATEKLATRADKLSKKSKRCPFVFQSLAPFLPAHARDGKIEMESDNEDDSETLKTMQKVMGVRKSSAQLNLLQTMQALLRYVLAGTVTKQFSLSAGLTHFAIIMRVASKAASEGKRHHVGVIYDQLARERWANMAFQAGSQQFDINGAMSKYDDQLYQEAVRISDKPVTKAPVRPLAAEVVPPPPKGNGKGRFPGVCNFCNKQGHRKADCYQWKAFQRSQGEGAPEENDNSAGTEPPRKKFKAPWPQKQK